MMISSRWWDWFPESGLCGAGTLISEDRQQDQRGGVKSSSLTIDPVSLHRAKNFPEFQYPSIVGRPILRAEERAGDVVVKDIMCGDEAAAARTMLQITYPVGYDSACLRA